MRSLFLLFVLMNIQTSIACDCLSTTIEKAFKDADLVVKGVVLTKRTIIRDVSATYIDSFQIERDDLYFKDSKILEYDILVENTYKGKLSNDTLKLRTYLPGNCYLDLEVGSLYFVYAFLILYQDRVYDSKMDTNTFSSSRCSKTVKYEFEEGMILDKLRKD